MVEFEVIPAFFCSQQSLTLMIAGTTLSGDVGQVLLNWGHPLLMIISQQSLSQNVTTSIRHPTVSHHHFFFPPRSSGKKIISPHCFLMPQGVIGHALLPKPVHAAPSEVFNLLSICGRWGKRLGGATHCAISNDPGVLQRGKADLRRCTYMQSWDLRQ